MAFSYKDTTRTARMQQIVTDIGTSGKLYIMKDPRQKVASFSKTGFLAEFTLAATAGTVSNGVLTFNAPTGDATVAATGTATWAAFCTSADTCIATCSINATADSPAADMQITSTSLTIGDTLTIASVKTITEGNAEVVTP